MIAKGFGSFKKKCSQNEKNNKKFNEPTQTKIPQENKQPENKQQVLYSALTRKFQTEQQEQKIIINQKHQKLVLQQQDIKKDNINIFEDYHIIFFGVSVSLSYNRIKIMKKQIEKLGGTAYNIKEVELACQGNISDFLRNPSCIIIGAYDFNFKVFENGFKMLHIDYNLEHYKIIDCDWVSKCLSRNKIISTIPFQIEYSKIMGCHNYLEIKEIQNLKQDEQDNEQDDENILTNSKNILYKDTFKNIKEQQRQAYKYDRSLWDYTYDDKNFNKKLQYIQTKTKDMSEVNLPVKPLQPVKFGIYKKKTPSKIQNSDILSHENNNEQKQQKNKIQITSNNHTNQIIQNNIVEEENLTKKSSREYLTNNNNSQQKYSSLIQSFAKEQNNEIKNKKFRIRFISDELDSSGFEEEESQQQQEENKFECQNNQNLNNCQKKQENTEKEEQQQNIQLLQQPQKKMKQQDFINLNSSENQSENKFIIQELDELREYYKQMKDKGREIAYKKAIAAIKTVDSKIENEEQVDKIPYIGRKMKEKIKQIIKNGFTKKQQKVVQYNKKFVIMKTFGQIWGIGPNFALDLYQQGIETIEQLQDNINLLNKSQKIGLKYYYDFQQKIPRKETEEIFQLVQNAVKQLEKYPGQYQCYACGSYRRGVDFSGDVDILITKNDIKQNKKGVFLNQLIEKLQQEDSFLVDHLQMPYISTQKQKIENKIENNSNNILYIQNSKYQCYNSISDTYMGVCKLKNGQYYRRIDIKLYPTEFFGFALMHFTGSKEFNAQIRLLARKKFGYIMNDRGFFKIDQNGQKIENEQIKIACPDENSVFRVLGLEYKTPQQRNI